MRKTKILYKIADLINSNRKIMVNLNINELKQKWESLQGMQNIFSYKLNVSQFKYLSGAHNFYVELNPERVTLRRPPQMITSLNPPFDENKFNFTKINPLEIIMTTPYRGKEISLIINKSPLTKYHTLICPDVNALHVQRVTEDVLSFSVSFLLQLNENSFHIGYNSPGALASVNHLHLHLMHVESNLYIENAKLTLLSDAYIYRLSEDMPTEAICFVIYKAESSEEITRKVQKLYTFLMWLCDQNRPHNLFLKQDRQDSNVLKIFIYARENYCVIKDLNSLNIGFGELSGYVPVGDTVIYNSITEDEIISKILQETGAIYASIYEYFHHLPDNDVV